MILYDAPPRHAPERRSAGAPIHTSCVTRCGADGRRHGQRIAVLDDLDAEVNEAVLDLQDRLLVAGNSTREKNRVAGVGDTDFISSRDSFASAASGSPWLPVQMMTRFSRGMKP
jgi:hypothetical protein